MVRAAVLDHIGPARAAAVRCRAAEVVADPVRGLRYRAAATPGHDDALAGRLDTEAARAAADGMWSAVAALLADAARLTPDPGLREERLVRSVDALVGAGEVRDAGAMLPAVESTPESPLREAVLGYLAVNRGHAAEARSRLDRAWELVDPPADPNTAAMIATRHVLDALARGSGHDLVTWADRVVELAAPGSPAAVEAAVVRPLGTAASGRLVEAAEEYRAVAASVPHGPQTQRVTMGRGWLDVVGDDVDEARFALASAVPNAPLGGSSRISLWALGWLARARFLCGEWTLALSVVDQGRALAARTGIVLATPLLEWTAAQIHAMRGDRDRAEEAMLRGEAGPLDYEIMRIPSLLARAQVAEIGADHARVVRRLEPLTLLPPEGTVSEPGWWPWADAYANALVVLGRTDEADAFLRPHEELAAARGHRSTRARLGYARGRWHGATGDVDAARTAFETALGHLDGLPLRYDRARIGLAFGQTLRHTGRRREADPVLLEAREQFDALGSVVHVGRCDRELRAGTREDHDEPGRTELTPQESAVTDLVAGGLTNREVAAELHVTIKTVQYHLTRVYTKLGVRSRSELAARRRT
jgi:DNA-binding CsgD family transcriptional regulator